MGSELVSSFPESTFYGKSAMQLHQHPHFQPKCQSVPQMQQQQLAQQQQQQEFFCIFI